MQGRDREADMMIIATAVIEGLSQDEGEGNGWGCDSKRPFGFSDVDGSLVELLKIPVDDSTCDDAREYVAELYLGIGDFIRAKWATLSPGGHRP